MKVISENNWKMYFSVQFMTKSKIHFLSIKHGRKLPTRSPPTHEAGSQTETFTIRGWISAQNWTTTGSASIWRTITTNSPNAAGFRKIAPISFCWKSIFATQGSVVIKDLITTVQCLVICRWSLFDRSRKGGQRSRISSAREVFRVKTRHNSSLKDWWCDWRTHKRKWRFQVLRHIYYQRQGLPTWNPLSVWRNHGSLSQPCGSC